jgi:subtilisin-like proprotein convertase family protein
MNKLYSPLHTANIFCKKQFLRVTVFLLFMVVTVKKVNAQCEANPVTNQTVCNNTSTAAINFTGTASTFNWTNNTPSIGLAASGTGNIASFIALNASATAVTATITVTPSNGACTGTPISFTITVNPSPIVNITPTVSCGGVPNGSGPCNPLTASGNANTYVWSPILGLYLDCGATAPYTGTNLATVYAAPTSNATYTVTGTNTGCIKTATTQVNYTPPAPIIVPPSVNMCVGDPAVKLRVAKGTGSSQFCSGTVNIPVPDNNQTGAASSIFVSGIPASCTILGLSVKINMPHTWVGDMVFVLKAPNGQIINLDHFLSSTGGGGTTTGFVNTIISSSGTAALGSGTNPYSSTFKADAATGNNPQPSGPIGMFPTTNNWSSFLLASVANGSWTLGFYDGFAGNTGNLTSWCLDISYSCPVGIPSMPAVWSPVTHLYLDPATTIPYIAGTPVDSVWVRPVSAGVYTYQVTTQNTSSPYSFTNSAALSIPIGGVAGLYPSNVSVSGLPTTGIKVASVVLHGVNHTRSNDMDVVLQSPNGQNVLLMSDVGGANAINATYTFKDGASSMNLITANSTGTYNPTNNGVSDNFPAPGPGIISSSSPMLNMFTGNYNGTWKLFVVDDDGTSDQGIIAGGYTINFDTLLTCTSPPRTVIVTVSSPITITQQPVNQSVCIGASASFNVGVTGAGPFSYQWQVSTNGGATYNNLVNAAPYSGVNSNALTVNTPPITMSGYLFRVIINGGAGNGCSGGTSTAALLTINPLPTVTITANPLVIGPGQTTTIRSTVTPNPAATYIWYRNGIIVPGANADTILVDVSVLGDYQLQVIDVNGCTSLSNIVTIAHSFSAKLFTYPNPSRGLFQVRYYSEANASLQRSITVYNNRGARIITKAFTQTTPYQKIDVDVRTHGKGIYWIELRDANGKRVAVNRAVVL